MFRTQVLKIGRYIFIQPSSSYTHNHWTLLVAKSSAIYGSFMRSFKFKKAKQAIYIHLVEPTSSRHKRFAMSC